MTRYELAMAELDKYGIIRSNTPEYYRLVLKAADILSPKLRELK